MLRKLNLLLVAAVLAGCSSKHEEAPPKVAFEGFSKKTEYLLDQGETVIVDKEGQKHSLNGFPMMFTGKIEVTQSAHSTGSGQGHAYELEILPLTEEEKAALAPAEPAGESGASEYE